MHRFCIALLLATPMTSCAGTITAVTDRAITSDDLSDDPAGEKLKTLSGDRRLVRVKKFIGRQADGTIVPPGAGLITICAETQADAIAAHSGKGSLSVETRGAFSDEASAALTATYARTELSDVVRQLSWQMCNAYMNGLLDGPGFVKQLEGLQAGALGILMARAKQPAEANRGQGDGDGPDAAQAGDGPAAAGKCKEGEKAVKGKCVKAAAGGG